MLYAHEWHLNKKSSIACSRYAQDSARTYTEQSSYISLHTHTLALSSSLPSPTTLLRIIVLWSNVIPKRDERIYLTIHVLYYCSYYVLSMLAYSNTPKRVPWITIITIFFMQTIKDHNTAWRSSKYDIGLIEIDACSAISQKLKKTFCRH